MPSFISPLTDGAIESALTRLVNASTSSIDGANAEDPRSPLIFSSEARRRFSKSNTVDGVQRVTTLAEIQRQTSGGQLVSETFSYVRPANNGVRDDSGALKGADTNVTMLLNPKTISFKQPKRYTRQDTMNGSIIHHFTNSKGQNNDLLTISMQGNTGNISQVGSLEDAMQARNRLLAWHNLYALTHEQVLCTDNDGLPFENKFYITYVSALFPIEVTFTGIFTEVLEFSDSGTKPNSRDYSLSFLVSDITPGMDDLVARINSVIFPPATAVAGVDSRFFTSDPTDNIA